MSINSIDNQKNKFRHSPIWLLLVLIGAVFSVETLLMFLLPMFPHISEAVETFMDASSLSILTFPVFYFLVFRPLTQNITRIEQDEQKLQLAASVFSHAREGIAIADAEGLYVEVNDTFTRITGYSREEVLGKNPRILQSGRQTKEFYTAMWQALIEKGYWSGEIWNRRKNGEVYAAMLTISAVRDAAGKVQHYVAIFSDITPIKEQQKQLERIAHYDALTNLPNRVLFSDRLHQSIAQCQRRKLSLAVAYLDLDGFKEVNDTYGHNIGDELLIEISQRMKSVLREGDTLARIGGDEFVAVLVDLEAPDDSKPVLTRLLQMVADPVSVCDTGLQVSVSIGVSLYPKDGRDEDQLLRNADQAMYQAKSEGRNTIRFFQPSIQKPVPRMLEANPIVPDMQAVSDRL